MTLTYDELYGVNIDEYCIAHDTTLDKLIHKGEIDIDILKKNLKRLIDQDRAGDSSTALYSYINTVHAAIHKKQKHIQNMKDWQMNRAG